MKIINFTKWKVSFVSSEGIVFRTIEPSGIQLKAKEDHQIIGDADGVPLIQPNYFQELEDGTKLPKEQDGTIYIVSPIALQAWPERKDFFMVHDPVKDENKNIIGYRGLARLV